MVANGVDIPRVLPAPVNRPMVNTVVFDPTGTFLVRAGLGTDIWLVPVDGSQPQRLEGFPNNFSMGAAISPSGRLVAAAGAGASEETKVIRVWDLASGAVQVIEFEPPRREGVQRPWSGGEHDVNDLQFLDESTIVTAGVDGVRRWDLATGSFETIVPGAPGANAWMFMSADRGTMLTSFTGPSLSLVAGARYIVHDLRTGLSRGVETEPECDAPEFALGPAGEILAEGCEDGSVRVGRIGSDTYHLLLGHEARVRKIEFSPDGSRIASTSDDGTLRLWPMPDLSKPPLHTLPHDELIAKLKTLTNLRAVRDEASSTGWKVEVGPFPGWAEVPEW
jgi:WD40 repeat protein